MPLLAIPQQNMKLSKDQISKIVQSGRSFCSWLANLEKKKKTKTNVAIPLARGRLPGLVSNKRKCKK